MKYTLALTAVFAVISLLVIYVLNGSSQKFSINSNHSIFMTDTTLRLTSSAFEDGGVIPPEYTCDGSNINPPLTIEHVPEQAASLVLIMEDPDVPVEIREDQTFDHWIIFNISSEVKEIKAGEGVLGTKGLNTGGGTDYTGPCPPTKYDPSEHRYIFTLYALDTELDLEEGASKQEVLDAIDDDIISHATLTGRYERTGSE